jgi:TolA-binding protein
MCRSVLATFVVALLLMAPGRPAVAADDDGPRSKLTGPPRGHPLVTGRPSDLLRETAQQLRDRALDARDAADAIREQGKHEERAEDLDDRADDLEDRAHVLEERAAEQDAQGENATHGMVMPAPSPGLPSW